MCDEDSSSTCRVFVDGTIHPPTPHHTTSRRRGKRKKKQNQCVPKRCKNWKQCLRVYTFEIDIKKTLVIPFPSSASSSCASAMPSTRHDIIPDALMMHQPEQQRARSVLCQQVTTRWLKDDRYFFLLRLSWIHFFVLSSSSPRTTYVSCCSKSSCQSGGWGEGNGSNDPSCQCCQSLLLFVHSIQVSRDRESNSFFYSNAPAFFHSLRRQKRNQLEKFL